LRALALATRRAPVVEIEQALRACGADHEGHPPPDEVLWALRVVRKWTPVLLGNREASSGSLRSRELAIGPEGLWFEIDGERADLSRRRNARLLLGALVDAHAHATTSASSLTVADLVRAGWPDERMVGDAGALRVRVALSELRKLGLRSVLVRDGGGWRLAPDLRVVRASGRAR
jgi:hypothetical protein